jgi:peptide/nickel transport system substrate-binding protein
MARHLRHVTRRRFLGTSVGLAAISLLAACAPSAPAPAPTSAPAKPTEAAKPAATTAPAAPAAAQPPPTSGQAAAVKPAEAAKPAAAAQPATEIKRGGTLTHSTFITYTTMDPHLNASFLNPGYDAIYSGLVRFDLVDPKTGEHKVVGDLAESWEQPDPTTVTFKLKQGILFHDGTPFDASVAAWNIERSRDDPKSTRRSQLQVIEAVEAPDKTTLRIKLKTPSPGFIRTLAWANGIQIHMTSKAAFEKLGADGIARAPVGTGPFKFKQWIADDRLILEKNPDYFEKGADGQPLPYLDGFVSRFQPDPTVGLQDLRTGGVHLLESVAPKDVAAIKADANLAIDEVPWYPNCYFQLWFNATAAPFDNVKLRQAVLYAIDREGMSKAMAFGLGVPFYYPFFMPASMGYDDKILKYTYDPAKVKALLTEAGYPNGIDLELRVIDREPENTIAQFAQQMFEANGIRAKLLRAERTVHIGIINDGNFQFSFARDSFETLVDPDILQRRVKTGAAGQNGKFSDPELDQLVTEGGATVDPTRRTEIYTRVLTMLQERAYVGTGYYIPTLNAYRKDVQGLAYNFQVPRAATMWLSK